VFKLITYGGALDVKEITPESVYKDPGKLEINGLEHDDYLEIHFKDNGPGIDQKNMEDIFKPFFT